MSHWAWWLGGIALAAVPLVHWLILQRAFAVSGRYSALVDRVRHGAQPQLEVSAEELIAALRAETAGTFGDDALDEAPQLEGKENPLGLVSRQNPLIHLLFLGGLALGGLLSMWLSGGLSTTFSLRGDLFAQTLDRTGLPLPVLLGVGGALVGFGTRMAGGCTSGHGLCGLSRFQPGSLISTAAFFGCGIAVSFGLRAML